MNVTLLVVVSILKYVCVCEVAYLEYGVKYIAFLIIRFGYLPIYDLEESESFFENALDIS